MSVCKLYENDIKKRVTKPCNSLIIICRGGRITCGDPDVGSDSKEKAFHSLRSFTVFFINRIRRITCGDPEMGVIQKKKPFIRSAHSRSFLFAPNLRQAWVCFK